MGEAMHHRHEWREQETEELIEKIILHSQTSLRNEPGEKKLSKYEAKIDFHKLSVASMTAAGH